MRSRKIWKWAMGFTFAGGVLMMICVTAIMLLRELYEPWIEHGNLHNILTYLTLFFLIVFVVSLVTAAETRDVLDKKIKS